MEPVYMCIKYKCIYLVEIILNTELYVCALYVVSSKLKLKAERHITAFL